jgi:hypothetical protein
MKKTTIIAVFAFVALAFTACTSGTSETNAASTDTTVVTTDSTHCDTTCVKQVDAPEVK